MLISCDAGKRNQGVLHCRRDGTSRHKCVLCLVLELRRAARARTDAVAEIRTFIEKYIRRIFGNENALLRKEKGKSEQNFKCVLEN